MLPLTLAMQIRQLHQASSSTRPAQNDTPPPILPQVPPLTPDGGTHAHVPAARQVPVMAQGGASCTDRHLESNDFYAAKSTPAACNPQFESD